jgi:Mrp family chromosome partitioning ATPase
LRAIAAGLRPALVDANSANPALAQQLSVLAESGWEAVVAGQIPLGRALIESVNDRAVLLPLSAAVPWKALNKANLQSSLPWQILSTKYDVLLFDAGSVEHEQDAANLRALCDVANLVGVYAVCDTRCTTPDELITFSRRLKTTGVRVLGTIENFTGTASLGDDVA